MLAADADRLNDDHILHMRTDYREQYGRVRQARKAYADYCLLECIGKLCENTVYGIKIQEPELTSDILAEGSKHQCDHISNKYLLKFLVPSDVQWFKIGTPITIFSPYCKSFISKDGVKNELVELDNVCSNNSFFLFGESPGQNKCVSVFYVHEDTLFAIGKNALKFVAFKNSSTIDHRSLANSTSRWCLDTVLEYEVGATKMTNHSMPECKYYQHQTSYGKGPVILRRAKTRGAAAMEQVAFHQVVMRQCLWKIKCLRINAACPSGWISGATFNLSGCYFISIMKNDKQPMGLAERKCREMDARSHMPTRLEYSGLVNIASLINANHK
uniref:Uncharacterized protein n=1 Tax=Romanomermis culicivorax TaxID=13658 RepID=A0A915HN76_ROMCU